MKPNVFCLVFTYCVAQTISAEVPDLIIDKPTEECFTELNMNNEMYSKIYDDKLRIVNFNEDGIRVLSCLIKKSNYYTPEGEFIRENIIEEIARMIKIYVPHEVEDKRAAATKLYNQCGTRRGDGIVHEMANLHNCVMDAGEKLKVVKL